MTQNNKLTCDALVLKELLNGAKKGPEIVENVPHSKGSVYRSLRKLQNSEDVKEIDGNRYAHSDYDEGIEDDVRNFLKEWNGKYPDLDVAPSPSDTLKSIGEDPREEGKREKVKEIIKEQGFNPSPPISWKDRKKHTNELKKILKKWYEKLPNPSIQNKKVGQRVILHIGEKEYVNFEDFKLWKTGAISDLQMHPLFSDLENHIGGPLFETWNEFKNCGEKHYKKRQGVIDKIKEELEKRMNVKQVGPHEVKEKCDSYDSRLLNNIFQMASYITGGDDLEGFIETGLESGFMSGGHEEEREKLELEDDCTGITFWTSGIHSSHKSKEETIDTFKDIAFVIAEKYGNEIEELKESLHHIRGLKGKFQGIIKKYLHKPTFGGCCEYLVSGVSTEKMATLENAEETKDKDDVFYAHPHG